MLYQRPHYPNETAAGIGIDSLMALFGRDQRDRLFGRRFTYNEPATGCHVWQRDHDRSGITIRIDVHEPIRPNDFQLTYWDPAGQLINTIYGSAHGLMAAIYDDLPSVIRRHGRQPETADRRLEPDRQIDPAAGDLADHYLMFAGCRRARARDRKRDRRARDRQYSHWARQPETETAERGSDV